MNLQTNYVASRLQQTSTDFECSFSSPFATKNQLEADIMLRDSKGKLIKGNLGKNSMQWKGGRVENEGYILIYKRMGRVETIM